MYYQGGKEKQAKYMRQLILNLPALMPGSCFMVCDAIIITVSSAVIYNTAHVYSMWDAIFSVVQTSLHM